MSVSQVSSLLAESNLLAVFRVPWVYLLGIFCRLDIHAHSLVLNSPSAGNLDVTNIKLLLVDTLRHNRQLGLILSF